MARPNPRLVRAAEEHVRLYSDQLLLLKDELRTVERMFGGTVQLREVEENDIRRIRQWSNQAEVQRVLRRPPYSLQRWIEDIHRWGTDPDTFPFSIDKPTGGHIGFLVLKRLDHPWGGRMGQLDFVIINREYREYGYGTEAVETALSFAFDALDLKSVSLWTAADNEAAIRCFEKCDFAFTDVESDAIGENNKRYDRYQMMATR